MALRSPVAVVIWRRPDHLREVLQTVFEASPSHLYIIADGGRDGREDQLCLAARAVVDEFGWLCPVSREISNVNLGCRGRVESGLNWVFDQTDSCIVLEDDTVPNSSFFPYVDELLDRYRNDARVMMVSGTSLGRSALPIESSYAFQRWPTIWGWATWARAWKSHDPTLSRWPDLKRSGWPSTMFDGPSRELANGHIALFDSEHNGTTSSWDYRWGFSIMANNGLVAVPRVNLVRNIGAGAGATHHTASHPMYDYLVDALDLPLAHPAEVAPDLDCEEAYARMWLGFPRQLPSMKERIYAAIPPTLRPALTRAVRGSRRLRSRGKTGG